MMTKGVAWLITKGLVTKGVAWLITKGLVINPSHKIETHFTRDS